MIGCPRVGASTFLIFEVMIIEIDHVEAKRKFDESTGLNLLTFE